MEGVRDRAATVEIGVRGHAGHVLSGSRASTTSPARGARGTNLRLNELLRDFQVSVFARPLIVALLCAFPIYQASVVFSLFSGNPPRSIVVSIILLIAPLFVASYLFATKVCFDAVSPTCPRCARKLEHLGSMPHTSGALDFGPAPRLYACGECDERFAIGVRSRLAPIAEVRNWKQPLFGELRINANILAAHGTKSAPRSQNIIASL